jgi:hypothetical protein
MGDLSIDFLGGRIRGRGRDIIGDFSMSGTMESDGCVRIVKQYTEQHHVVYIGNYDGEGTLFGTWLIDLVAGAWSIKLLKDRSGQVVEFEEVLPLGQAGLR